MPNTAITPGVFFEEAAALWKAELAIALFERERELQAHDTLVKDIAAKLPADRAIGSISIGRAPKFAAN